MEKRLFIVEGIAYEVPASLCVDLVSLLTDERWDDYNKMLDNIRETYPRLPQYRFDKIL